MALVMMREIKHACPPNPRSACAGRLPAGHHAGGAPCHGPAMAPVMETQACLSTAPII